MPNSLASYDAQNHVTQTNAPGFTLTPPPPIYDGAGDVVNDGTNAYLYDAEGRICAVQTGSGATGYLYDAAGNRVAKGSISTMSCDITTNGFVQTAGYVVGPSGEQLTEVDGSGNWRHTNVYAGGKLIGTYDSAGLHFYFDDPLGTRRAQTNAAGLVEATYQSLPFGDGLAQNPVTTTDDPTENHFTGKERDIESGNDYMFARYYNSATGRFLSPDWDAKSSDPVPYAKLDNPQSLNLYSYVYNNPVDKTDPDGHDGVILNDSKAADGYGHNASVVGNDKDGWTYYSKDGSDTTNRKQNFATFSDFQKSDTGARYDRADRIATTPDQDKLMKKAGDASYNLPYSSSEKKNKDGSTKAENCADLTARVLTAGGVVVNKPKVTLHFFGGHVSVPTQATGPNMQYDGVVSNNKGKAVAAHIPDKKKDQN